MNNRAIGVFDSGIGGLTVAREIMKAMPGEEIIYFGDTARVPYGNKSQNMIIQYSRQITRFLLSREVKAIVIACNTASAYALDTLTKEFDIPILGVVRPGAKAAAQATKNGLIGVAGTKGTVASGAYLNTIAEYNPEATVIQKACPLFVNLAEEGWWDNSIAKQTAEIYLEDIKKAGVDTLVMGCTHYPLMEKAIAHAVGKSVRLVNPAYEAARELKELLSEHDLLADKCPGEHRLIVSDMAPHYIEFAGAILPDKIGAIEKIDIEKY